MGRNCLKDRFGYSIPCEQTGECWAISAHPNGQSVVRNSSYQGMTLGQLWAEQPQLFAHHPSQVFPLLIKILDANQDLSVQVHPDDTYAQANENGELGKTECWYIIDCKPDAEIVFGHHAQSKEELEDYIRTEQWDSLLRRVKIKPGDFFYVPSGTIHALCEGTLVLETQQSSDTTYRVYDYHRQGAKGMKRELHLDKALDVITVPHYSSRGKPTVKQKQDAIITTFLEGEYFSVHKWSVRGMVEATHAPLFLLCSVIEGEGEIMTEAGTFPLKKADHFLVPSDVASFSLKGTMEMIVSHI